MKIYSPNHLSVKGKDPLRRRQGHPGTHRVGTANSSDSLSVIPVAVGSCLESHLGRLPGSLWGLKERLLLEPQG